MADGSSSCSSLPAPDLELEREMKIYIHDALGFNLKTEQEESIFEGSISLPTGLVANLCYWSIFGLYFNVNYIWTLRQKWIYSSGANL